MLAQHMRGPRLLLSAAVLLLALHTVTAASSKADVVRHTDVLNIDLGDQALVEPGQSTVTVATVHKPKKGPKRPGLGLLGRKTGDVTVTTTVTPGPLARWKANRKAKQQAKQQAALAAKAGKHAKPSAEEQEEEMEQEPQAEDLYVRKQKKSLRHVAATAAAASKLGSSSRGGRKGAHAAKVGAASALTATSAIGSSASPSSTASPSDAAAQEQTDKASLQIEADSNQQADIEIDLSGAEAQPEAADTDDTDSTDALTSLASGDAADGAPQVTANSTDVSNNVGKATRRAAAAQREPAGDTSSDQAAASGSSDEQPAGEDVLGEELESEGKKEEEQQHKRQHKGKNKHQQRQQQQGRVAKDAPDAAVEVAQPMTVGSSSAKDAGKVAEASEQDSASEEEEAVIAKIMGSASKSKQPSSSSSSGSTGGAEEDSSKDSISPAKPASKKHTDGAAKGHTSSSSSSRAEGLPATLTSKSKTISLGSPSSDDEPSSSVVISSQETVDVAGTTKPSGNAATAVASTSGSKSSSGPKVHSHSKSTKSESTTKPKAGHMDTAAKAQLQAAGAATSTEPQDNRPSLSDGESVLNLDFATIALMAKGAAQKGNLASALGGSAAAPVGAAAAAMDGPVSGPGSSSSGPDKGVALGQAAAGGLSAGQLRSAMNNVASVRDVVIKLAAKPNLLQYVQQKQIRQLADALDGADVAQISAMPGLLGMPKIYRAGDDIDSQLYAKKTAIAAAMVLFSHLTPDQAVNLAGVLIPEFVTLGATFEHLNTILYDAPVNAQLDEVFDAVMAGKVASSSSSEDDGLIIEDGSISSSSSSLSSSKEHTVTVSKASKVAAFLILGLLMQARVLVCGV